MPPAMADRDGDGGATPTPDALSLFASRLSRRRYQARYSTVQITFRNISSYSFSLSPASTLQVRGRGSPGAGGGAVRRRRRPRAARHAIGGPEPAASKRGGGIRIHRDGFSAAGWWEQPRRRRLLRTRLRARSRCRGQHSTQQN